MAAVENISCPLAEREYSSPAARRAVQRLCTAVAVTTLPELSLRRPREKEDFGLTLLELSLPLEHVKRQTEHLTVIGPRHLRRRMTLDVDISGLTGRHLRALTAHERNPVGTPHLWVPVANWSRADVAPVVVRGSDDRVVPRMTLQESLHAYSAGLVKLFDMLVEANPNARDSGHPLYELRTRRESSRWLVEAAVNALIHGEVPIASRPGSTWAPGRDVREYAVEALGAMQASQPHAFEGFLELLDAASEEYPLVVLLDGAVSNAFLSLDAPLLPARPGPTGWWRRSGWNAWNWVRAWLSPYRAFLLVYHTNLSRSAQSHHLTVEVPQEINVRRFVLSSDADLPIVTALISDMREVGRRYDDLLRINELLLESELRGIVERLSNVVTRRTRDASQYRQYLEEQGVHRLPRPEPRTLPRPLDSLLRWNSRHLDSFLRWKSRPLARLRRFLESYQAGEYSPLTGALSGPRLRKLADRIKSLDLGSDLTVDNDPRENGAHAQWRRRDAADDSLHWTEPVAARVHLTLTDDPPSLYGSVSLMVLALMAILYLTGHYLFDSWTWPWPWAQPHVAGDDGKANNADAIVTVLLLVPGLLLTRLDLPAVNTALGQIRLLPRILAYGAVLLLATLAAAVGAWSRLTVTPFHYAATGLGAVLLYCGAIFVWGRWLAGKTAAREAAVPEWVRREFKKRKAGRIGSRFAPAAVHFEVTREQD